MRVKTFLLLILIYLISFIAIRNNINIFAPYYLIKDFVFLGVSAIGEEVKLDDKVQEGIELELRHEIEELKKLNDIDTTLTDFTKVSATIIERNKMYWFNTITINKGTNSGIKEDMAVISKDGLLGRITKVSKNTSEVKLITTNDVNHKISVMIKLENDTIYGIMSGYDSNNNILIVTSVNKEIEIPKDSFVYTSGMGGIFPSGIIIGKIKEMKKDKYDTSKIIEVEPFTDFNNTRFVNVLIRK